VSEQPPSITVEDLWYRYSDDTVALCGINLKVPQGAFVAVLGQNGSGKSTLVKHFNGLLRPTRGRVLVDGWDTRETSLGRLARTVGYVFQNPDHQIFCATTREEIRFGPQNLGLAPEEIERRTEQALETFGLQPYADQPPALLGFGLRRKISVAAVYAMRPQIFVLDEPTTGLDWRSTLDLLERVQGLHRKGHTILLVTHDMRIAAAYAERTLVLKDGRVLLYGDTRSVFHQRDTLRAAHIQPPQITELAWRMRSTGMPEDVLTVQECFEAYRRLRETGAAPGEDGSGFQR